MSWPVIPHPLSHRAAPAFQEPGIVAGVTKTLR